MNDAYYRAEAELLLEQSKNDSLWPCRGKKGDPA